MDLTIDLRCKPPIRTSCPQRVAAVDSFTGRGGRGFQERVRGDVIGLSLDGSRGKELPELEFLRVSWRKVGYLGIYFPP